jgi:hypothetical protein
MQGARAKWRETMNARPAFAILAVGLLAAACASPVATLERTISGDPAKPYLGKSKAEIMACAGAPFASYKGSSTETITYHYSGAGPVPGGDAKKPGEPEKPGLLITKKSDKNWKCTASLTFEADHLIRVTFAPQVVVSPYADQSDDNKKKKSAAPAEPVKCTFVLSNCGG